MTKLPPIDGFGRLQELDAEIAAHSARSRRLERLMEFGALALIVFAISVAVVAL